MYSLFYPLSLFQCDNMFRSHKLDVSLKSGKEVKKTHHFIFLFGLTLENTCLPS